jgi:hypothetical protein
MATANGASRVTKRKLALVAGHVMDCLPSLSERGGISLPLLAIRLRQPFLCYSTTRARQFDPFFPFPFVASPFVMAQNEP